MEPLGTPSSPYNPKKADSVRGISSDIGFLSVFGSQRHRENRTGEDLRRAVEVLCAIIDFERPYSDFEGFCGVKGA